MLTQSDLKAVMDYNPDSGLFTWKKRHDVSETWNARFPGKAAGSLETIKYGYRRIRIGINGKLYLAHRLAWLYMTGEFPAGEIDHIDRDPSNNKWDNLRDVTHRENSKNQSMPTNNSSGVAGVCWHKRDKKWRAQMYVDGKRKSISFDNISDAERAFSSFKLSADYSVDHGQPRRY